MRSGAGAVVLVEGEPGMGKTRLLAEAARVARRLAFRVGDGAAEPGAEIVELAPLMTALFDGSQPLLDPQPDLRGTHGRPRRGNRLADPVSAIRRVCAWGQPSHSLLERVSAIDKPVFVANGDSDRMILPRYS